MRRRSPRDRALSRSGRPEDRDHREGGPTVTHSRGRRGPPPLSSVTGKPRVWRAQMCQRACQAATSAVSVPAKRRRRRALDADVDELPRRRVAAEVDRGVPTRPAPQERWIRAARALDENLLDAADALCVSRSRRRAGRPRRAARSAPLQLVRHLVGHRGGLGAAARAEDEREGAVEPTSSTTSSVSLEVRSVSPGKPDDEVGRQRKIRNGRAQPLDEREVALPGVRSPHRLQEPRRA